MATIKDILGDKTYEYEQNFKKQGLSGETLKQAMIDLARQTRDQLSQQPTTTNSTQEYLLNSSDTLPSIARGLATPIHRGIAFANWVDDKVGFDLISDETAEKNAKILEKMEETKKRTSQKDLTPNRLEELKALENESANAKGFVENVKAGAKQLWDSAYNVDEWTTQGVIENLNPLDPANAIGLITGGIGGKIASKIGGGLLSKIGVGVSDGVASNAGAEYAIAKGSNKDDEEAKKIAIQSGVAGAIIPTAYATAGAIGTKIPKMEIKKQESFKKILDNPLLDKSSLEDALMGDVADKTHIDTIVETQRTKENIQMIKLVDDAEKISTDSHEQTKLKLQEALQNGATLDEMIAIRDGSKPDESIVKLTKIINNNEATTNRLSGFKIVNVIEDTIKQGTLKPEEVKQKLINENVSEELADVATKSYKVKDTDMLLEFMQTKIEQYLDIKHTKIKDEIEQKVDIYNKEKIADEQLWSTSLTKASLDEFISKEIGDENINDASRAMIYDLHKIGLVTELESKKLQNDINGKYDTINATITLNQDNPKTQTLIHEYIHSATSKLLENKRFKEDVTALMESAKAKLGRKKEYGFVNADEFVAEAFSNPSFASSLNDIKLTTKMRERFGVKEYVESLWDVIVEKFGDMVFEATGKRIKIDNDSYFAQLNTIVKKEVQELEDIKTKRIEDGSSLERGEADQKLPQDLRLWTDENSPQPERLKANSDGVFDGSSIGSDAQSRKPLLSTTTDAIISNKDIVIDKASILSELNNEYIKNNATNLAPKFDLLGFVSQMREFGGVDKFLNHLADKTVLKDEFGEYTGEGVNRFKFLNYVPTTLKTPMFVLKDGNKYTYFKSFSYKLKGKEKIVRNLVVTMNKNGNIELVTSMPSKLRYVKSLIEKAEEVYRGVGYFDFHPSPDQTKSHLGQKVTNEIISNNKDLSQGGKIDTVTNQTADREDVHFSRESADSTTKQPDGKSQSTRGDNVTDNDTSKIPDEDKRMERQSTAFDDERALSKLDTDEVVQPQSKKGDFKSVKQNWYDKKADHFIDRLDKFFHGLDKDGKIKQDTIELGDKLRKILVTDPYKSKEFVSLLQENQKEKARSKVYARGLQEDLGKLSCTKLDFI